jgi:transposase
VPPLQVRRTQPCSVRWPTPWLSSEDFPVIRIDTLWLCTQPQDMRCGADRLLNVVINTVGQARAHHGYLFANARATRIKLLVHDGFGVWCATRRLHAGRFVWLDHGATAGSAVPALQLTAQQFDALALGLPWQRLDEFGVISRS